MNARVRIASFLACSVLLLASAACRSSASGAMGPELPPATTASTDGHGSDEALHARNEDEPAPRVTIEPKPVVVQVRTDADARPAAEEPKAAVAAPTPNASEPGVLPNRDRHGPPDVARTIASLQRADRVGELKIDVVLDKLELPPDATIGDLGCGPGVFTIPFARRCPEGVVYASDLEPRQLDVVREKLRATNLRNIVPVLASEDDPHFPPAQLDIVFVADTYHHLENRVAYFERVAKALKPGGRLVVLDYKPGSLPVGPPAEHKPAAGVRARELTQAGWKLVDTFDTHRWQDFEVWRRLQPWETK